MPLQSVEDIIKQKLSFVPQTGWETKIETYKHEQMYYLNEFLIISETGDETVIEDEANWIGMKRLLLAEITTYQLIINKVISTTGGAAGETTGSGSKMIKKAKADVVDAEFEYAKADDGRTIAMKTEALLPELKANVCRYAKTLNINLPGYCPEERGDLPPFQIVNPE